MAEALAGFLAGRPADRPVFDLPDKTAAMLRVDLDAAGIPYRDDAGRVLDFHALRASFITALAMSGAPAAVAKTLACHSTITLTLDAYTLPAIADERRALDALPALLASKAEKAAGVA